MNNPAAGDHVAFADQRDRGRSGIHVDRERDQFCFRRGRSASTGMHKTTTFVSATQVTAAITAADIATAGTFNVSVTNPAPGGGASGNSPFTVNNPVPTITSLSPTSAIVGGVAFTLTVNGTNFVSGAVVNFNGNAKTTTFVSATQVTAAITRRISPRRAPST